MARHFPVEENVGRGVGGAEGPDAVAYVAGAEAMARRVMAVGAAGDAVEAAPVG